MADLTAYALSLLLRMPVYHEDREEPGKRAQLEQLAISMAKASKGQAWVVKALTVVGNFETHFSLRIQSGECRRNECDRGKAAGTWQLHVGGSVTQTEWEELVGLDPAAVDLSASEAATTLRRAVGMCRKEHGDHVRMMFSSYAGRGCHGSFKGLDERVALYRSLP